MGLDFSTMRTPKAHVSGHANGNINTAEAEDLTFQTGFQKVIAQVGAAVVVSLDVLRKLELRKLAVP